MMGTKNVVWRSIKTKCLGSALKFHERYDAEGDDFVTNDETWLAYVTLESEQQFMEWPHSTTKGSEVQADNINLEKFVDLPWW